LVWIIDPEITESTYFLEFRRKIIYELTNMNQFLLSELPIAYCQLPIPERNEFGADSYEAVDI